LAQRAPCEFSGFADHRFGGFEIEIAEPARLDRRRETRDMLKRIQDVGDRRAITHGVPHAASSERAA
jgi:hypothetical protein